MDANAFLFDIQQRGTKISRKDPDYKLILDRLDISPQLVENTEAQQTKKSKRPMTVLNAENPNPISKNFKRQDGQQPREDSEAEEEIEKGG